MNRAELIKLMLSRFYSNFAAEISAQVIATGATARLYNLVTEQDTTSLSTSDRDKVLFRGAYVLETIYFTQRQLFDPLIPRFWNDFSNTSNRSAQRHFTKIMSDLLTRTHPTATQSEAIAESCVSWITEPHTRVAVQIWAMEVLFLLQAKVSWLPELLPELLETLHQNPTPAIECRLKRWRKQAQ